MGGDNKGWPAGRLTDTATKPVRFPTRDEIMADSRKASWHPLPAPFDRDVILTRHVTNAAGEDFWIVDRRRCKPDMIDYLNGREATHWHEDTLGHP